MDAVYTQRRRIRNNADVFNPTDFLLAFLHVSRNLSLVKFGMRIPSTLFPNYFSGHEFWTRPLKNEANWWMNCRLIGRNSRSAPSAAQAH